MAYDQVDGHHMAGIPEHGADVEYLMEAEHFRPWVGPPFGIDDGAGDIAYAAGK